MPVGGDHCAVVAGELPRCDGGRRLARDPDLPGGRLAHADEHVDQLVLTVAVDAGHAEDLALADLERQRVEARATLRSEREAAHLQDRCSRHYGWPLHSEHDVAADHHAGQRRLVGGRGVLDRADHLPVAQHGAAVGHGQELVQLVRDEDGGAALGHQRSQHRRQLLPLWRCQHGGRLVEDEELRTSVQQLQDLDPLLHPDREVLDAIVGIDEQPVAARELDDPGRDLAEAGQRRPAGPQAERHVLGHGHVRYEHEVLVDHADPVRHRSAGAAQPDRRAVHLDGALVGLEEPVEDVHQRGLARTVLPEQPMDLPPLDHQIDAVVGSDAREALRDPGHPEERRHGRELPRLVSRRRGSS